jgi:hypothetical protein
MAGRVLPIRRATARKLLRHYNPPAAPAWTRASSIPTWRTGDKVRWQVYSGTFLRETVAGEAELLIGTRTYHVARGELQPA